VPLDDAHASQHELPRRPVKRIRAPGGRWLGLASIASGAVTESVELPWWASKASAVSADGTGDVEELAERPSSSGAHLVARGAGTIW